MQLVINGMAVRVIQGDITDLETDAITNAANSQLQLGAGVAGAIALKGGDSIQKECDEIGYCEVGSAVITSGGTLKAKYVIHAVGPRMGEGDEHNKLAKAVRSVLKLAETKRLESVALPAISTGIFGFPLADCAKIMSKEIINFSFEPREYTHIVVVCLFDEIAYRIFRDTWIQEVADLNDNSQDATLLLDEKDIK